MISNYPACVFVHLISFDRRSLLAEKGTVFGTFMCLLGHNSLTSGTVATTLVPVLDVHR